MSKKKSFMDVDIIISSAARHQLFNGNRGFMRLEGCEILEPNKSKFNINNY